MRLGERDVSALAAAAEAARRNARAPYSGVTVGAAVLTADGRVFGGCNVESASLGLTLCAERAAMAAAVHAGSPAMVAVVVVSEPGRPVPPCGACLQWIAELGGPSCEVIWTGSGTGVQRALLRRLLPEPFAGARQGGKDEP